MSIKQVHRGNPVLKQYNITNNFSGGINTTDVDEVTLTNQFRELQNVELLEKGMLQNRKGFGFSPVLNYWIKEYNDLVENGTLENEKKFLEECKYIYHVDILFDNMNIANIMTQYDTYDEFHNDHESTDFKLMIGILYQADREIRYGTFEVICNLGEAIIPFWHYDITNGVLPFKATSNKLTNVNSVVYNNKLYINLSEINEEIQSILEVEINWDTEHPEHKIHLINGETAHKINPFELTSIGYNVLSNNPLHISETELLTLNSIRALYITDYNDANSILDTIPEDGMFQLHAIKSGIDITTDYVGEDDVQFFIDTQKLPPNDEKILGREPLEVLEKGEGSAKLVWRVKLKIEDYSKPINIRIRKIMKDVIPVEPPDGNNIYGTWATTEEMMEDLLSSGQAYYTERLLNNKRVATVYVKDKYNYINAFLPKGSRRLNGNYLNIYRLWHSNTEGTVDDDDFGGNPDGLGSFVGRSGIDDTLAPDPEYDYDYIQYKTELNPLVNYGGFSLRDIPIIEDWYNDSSLFPEHFKIDFKDYSWRPVIVDDGTTEDPYMYFAIFHANGKPLPNVARNTITGLLEEAGISVGDTGTIEEKLKIEQKTELEISNLNLQTASAGKYFRVGTDEDNYEYYIYLGGNSYTIGDFIKWEEEPFEYEYEVFSFTTFYNISGKSEPRTIESLDLSNFKMLAIKDRLCIYSGNTMWFSHLFKFDYFPEFNYVVLPLMGDDEIIRIAYFRGSYVIFTKYNLYRMSGSFGSEDFEIVLISDSIGCISGDSVRNINNTLIFLSTDGLYTIKQNYFVGGLENVEKVDKQIKGLITNTRNVESLLYNEQLLLFLKDLQGNYTQTVKQYYNMPIYKDVYAYTTDTYKYTPDNIFKLGNYVYSIKEGYFYQYDRGYTDFYNIENEELDKKDYMYKTIITTPNYMLGYPTHNKKFKNLYIKTRTNKVNPVKITIYIDDNMWINPQKYQATITGNGEVIYNIVDEHNLITRHARLGNNPSEGYNEISAETDGLGSVIYHTGDGQGKYVENVTDFTTGLDILGDAPHQVHKLTIAGKGKAYSVKIEQELDEMFGILDIGVLYKLGKVKEG